MADERNAGRINVNAIPLWAAKKLGEGTAEAARRFFAKPGVEEKFQAWLAEQEAERAAAQALTS